MGLKKVKRKGKRRGKDGKRGRLSALDRLEVTVAERDTNGGTGDAHGGRDGKTVLGSENDGDGGSELHRETTGGRVEGDLVTEDLHDVVTVRGETDDDHDTSVGENPDGDGRLAARDLAGTPDMVDYCKRPNSVRDVCEEKGGSVSTRKEKGKKKKRKEKTNRWHRERRSWSKR
jgi:hypothetical protein